MTKHILTLILSLTAIVATAGPLANSIKAGKEIAAHDKARQYAATEYSESMAGSHSISFECGSTGFVHVTDDIVYNCHDRELYIVSELADCDKAPFLNLADVGHGIVYECTSGKFYPASMFDSE